MSRIHVKENSKRIWIMQHPDVRGFSGQTRYSAKLYNVEGLDHKVHEPITIPGMADMQSQDNWGMAKLGFNFF